MSSEVAKYEKPRERYTLYSLIQNWTCYKQITGDGRLSAMRKHCNIKYNYNGQNCTVMATLGSESSCVTIEQ